MIRVGCGVDEPMYHPPAAALSLSRSTSVWDGERGCSQRDTTRLLKGRLVLKGAGSQLTGAEELIQSESSPPRKVETLKHVFYERQIKSHKSEPRKK